MRSGNRKPDPITEFAYILCSGQSIGETRIKISPLLRAGAGKRRPMRSYGLSSDEEERKWMVS